MGKPLVAAWTACEGRNGWDHPIDVSPDMGVEALNVNLQAGRLGTKRSGSSDVTLTGDTFSGINALIRFVPGQDETAAELFLVSNDGTTKILRITAAVGANLTLTDNVASTPIDVFGAILNGKLFLSYDSTVNRLHVFAPSESTTQVRRVGLPAAGAPTVANTGAGSYPAQQRWYRIAWRVKSGSTILRQGEFGTATAFTPSGTGTAARVTKPTASGEGETHWVVAGAAESIDGPFYLLSEIAVGTTTYDDSADPDDYDINDAVPIDGSAYPFLSTKYILSDGTRLFGLGVWETAAGDSVTPKPGTLYWTPPLGATDGGDHPLGDDERIQHTLTQDDWLHLGVNAGGVDRGLAGPFYNDIYCFQSRGIYKAVPTGNVTRPFRRVVVSRKYGAVSQQSIILAEDELGNEAIYFLDPEDGPRRIVVGSGIQWLGKDVSDLWATVNLSATTIVAHGVYKLSSKQIVWWISTGSNNTPTLCLVYHVTLGRTEGGFDVRRGWAKWDGLLSQARCSLLFASTLAATRPLTNTIYFEQAGTLCRQDTTLQDRNTTAFQSYVTSKAWDFGILPRRKRLTESYLTATTVTGACSVRQTITKDFGMETLTQDVSLMKSGAGETMVRRRFEGTDISDAIVLQVQVGDAAALGPNPWTLDRWDGIVEAQEGAK